MLLFADAESFGWINVVVTAVISILTGIGSVGGAAWVYFTKESQRKEALRERRKARKAATELKLHGRQIEQDQDARAKELKLDKSLADYHREMLIEERERRAQDNTFYTLERETWQKLNYKQEERFLQLMAKHTECEKTAAVQATQLKFHETTINELRRNLTKMEGEIAVLRSVRSSLNDTSEHTPLGTDLPNEGPADPKDSDDPDEPGYHRGT